MTASELVQLISQLPKGEGFSYIGDEGRKIEIVSVTKPDGPIVVKRPAQVAKTASISKNMLSRVADGIHANVPFNIDRLLAASGNTRSVLEALLAHTPPFYYCYPGRIERVAGAESITQGSKHLVWCPGDLHENGKLCQKNIDAVFSEVPGREIFYDAIILTKNGKRIPNIDPSLRRHTQIQISLFVIGQQLGYRTWIAQNDRNIEYQDKKLIDHPRAIKNLQDEKLLEDYNDAQKAALMIDCIWFKNSHLLPAVMEIEHSTGITSGLDRMQTLYEYIKPFQTRWVIVAPDEDRSRVFRHCQKPQFKKMRPRYFPYSAVEELHSLCLGRKLRGVTEDFLDCFMEETVQA